MGMILLLPKNSALANLIPTDLIESFEEVKLLKGGRNVGKQEVYAQGSIIWIKEHYIKICFVYLREKPTVLELKKIRSHWKSFDLIIGDSNSIIYILDIRKIIIHPL